MSAKVPAKMGRPTIYTPEIASLICELIADGKTLREVAKHENLPCMATICKWLCDTSKIDFVEQYALAREVQAELELDEIRQLSDKATPKNVQVKRLQVDTRKFRIEKMAPKKYGKQLLEVTGKDGASLFARPVTAEERVLLAKALARMGVEVMPGLLPAPDVVDAKPSGVEDGPEVGQDNADKIGS